MEASHVIVICYRGAKNLSTKIKIKTVAACLAIAMTTVSASAVAQAPAPTVSKVDPAAMLPAGALKDAASLYLREAAATAVRWQPWSADSLELARSLKRPILIDIGAVWCHWCHVMDQTTYADPQVAGLINGKFVPIKVDSDERPDIDGYYQEAAQVFGAGGWPLTCFTTPDGAPLLIAGYMPPQASASRGVGMTNVLGRVADAYANDPGFPKMAHDIAAKIASKPSVETSKHGSREALQDGILRSISENYDPQRGGFGSGSGPRFYDFPALQLALAHGVRGHPELTAIALTSLRKIAAGGVYDQLGGGFHRYSTDAEWRVPHFEKMGYDQAMAIATCALAYRVSRDEEFARLARGTIGYVNTTLLDPKTHTFYSHQDADAFPGDDGSYYTWTKDEVVRALDPGQARVAMLYFGFDQDPGHAPDGRVVLRRAIAPDDVAARLKLGRAETRALLASAIARMVAARERRRSPKVDHAVLVDRNALMATAYLTASGVFGDQTLRRIALDDLDYLIAHARAPDGSFYHVLSGAHPTVPGLVADQVYMLGALVAACEAQGEPRCPDYLDKAKTLAGLVMNRFRDPISGLLRDREPAEKGTVLSTAKGNAEVLYDHPMPSVQASASIALESLAVVTSNKRYSADAARLLASAPGLVGPDAGTMVATLGLALEHRARASACGLSHAGRQKTLTADEHR